VGGSATSSPVRRSALRNSQAPITVNQKVAGSNSVWGAK
jgi:hypothetical protein